MGLGGGSEDLEIWEELVETWVDINAQNAGEDLETGDDSWQRHKSQGGCRWSQTVKDLNSDHP